MKTVFPWYVFALATAVLAAFASVVEKNTLNFGDESPLQYSTMFALLNAFFSLFLLPFVDLSAPLHVYGVTYVSALLGSTLGFLLVAKAMNVADISKVSPLLNINPVFVAVLATVFLGEGLTLWQVGGIVLIVGGAYVLEMGGTVSSLFDPIIRLVKQRHGRLMVLAALVYAASSVLNKYVLEFFSSVTLLVVLQLMIAVNFVAYMFVRSDGGAPARMKTVVGKATNRWHWVLLAAVMTTSYRLLQMQAFSMAMVSLVVPIKRLSNLLSTIIGGELFQEEHLLQRSLASAIMVVGAYLVIVM